MMLLRRVCVFCGSRVGESPEYHTAAFTLGVQLARRGLGLVYGGGRVGLMGVLADAVLEEGGSVIGVIPASLMAREVGHAGVTDLRIVDSMHERKAMMADLSDAFVALPGGIGTMEELFEVWSWAVLGVHSKPCGLLNIGGYYDPLMHFIDHACEQKFVRRRHRGMLLVDSDGESLLRRLESYQPPEQSAWISPEKV